MRKLILIAALTALLCSCNSPLPRGDWNKDVRKELNKLIKSEGSSSKKYDADCPPYAVFDFDNTTIINDVELCVTTYQIEFLRFKISPDQMPELLLRGVPDPDATLENISDHEVSARMLVEDICEDYSWLYSNYISLWISPTGEEARKALEKIDGKKEYRDFRAKLIALGNGIQSTFGYAEACFWTENLFNGMTEGDIAGLVRDAADHNMAMKKVSSTTWESPNRGKAGRISVSFAQGMGLTDEMKCLYSALKDNGFDIYILSASREAVVEALACDTAFGLDMAPENVYGLRFLTSQGGTVRFDSSYIQPYTEGKANAINAYIVPKHGGKDPALVAGDSNGDFAMLTSFPSLRIGLIVNCLRSGEISQLARYALDGNTPEGFTPPSEVKYVVQGRDYCKKKFIRSSESIGLK